PGGAGGERPPPRPAEARAGLAPRGEPPLRLLDRRPGAPATRVAMTRATRAVGIAVFGILAVFWVQYLVVRPTNFGGWDEWLVIDLTYRGIVAIPYQNRPFSYVFHQPGALLLPASLRGYWLINGLYLSLTGAFLCRLVQRLAPARAGLAFLAGVFRGVWGRVRPVGYRSPRSRPPRGRPPPPGAPGFLPGLGSRLRPSSRAGGSPARSAIRLPPGAAGFAVSLRALGAGGGGGGGGLPRGLASL